MGEDFTGQVNNARLGENRLKRGDVHGFWTRFLHFSPLSEAFSLFLRHFEVQKA